MTVELLVSLAIAFIALVSGLIRGGQLVSDARGRVDKLLKAKVTQVERLRKAAKTSLMLKRNIREALVRLEATERDVIQAQGLLEVAEAVDHRLFVLDDRRTKVDLCWVVTVIHPNYAQQVNHNILPATAASWQKGRRFLVYALDPEKAKEKAATRFPERNGFVIESVTAQKLGKGAAAPG